MACRGNQEDELAEEDPDEEESAITESSAAANETLKRLALRAPVRLMARKLLYRQLSHSPQEPFQASFWWVLGCHCSP